MPSQSSLLSCLTIGIIVPAVHVLYLGGKRQAYVQGNEDTISKAYAQYVLNPLQATLNNSSLENVTTILLWGTCGWVVYMIVMWTIQAFTEWRQSEEYVSILRAGIFVRHPTLKGNFLHSMWRLVLISAIVGYTVGVLLILHGLLANDELILHASNPVDSTVLATASILLWAAIFHSYLVLLRLFLGRTRIFGELLY